MSSAWAHDAVESAAAPGPKSSRPRRGPCCVGRKPPMPASYACSVGAPGGGGGSERARRSPGRAGQLGPAGACTLPIREEIIKIIFHIVIMRKAQISTHFYISFSL